MDGFAVSFSVDSSPRGAGVVPSLCLGETIQHQLGECPGRNAKLDKQIVIRHQ